MLNQKQNDIKQHKIDIFPSFFQFPWKWGNEILVEKQGLSRQEVTLIY